jgi:4'-phosphopantetheinyl transferase EntD
VIEAILPAAVAVAEKRGEEAVARLFPEEEALVARAVQKRRREFASGRACAHRALGRLGFAPGPVLAGERGEPLWPAGAVGSITHCDGYRGCAVARAADLAAIGIDAEPHAPLPEGLIADVAHREELPVLAELARAEPGVHWDRLLFSAKEAVYKAWFPLAERWLGFEDAVLTIDPERRRFSARLLVPGPVLDGAELSGLDGSWLVEDGLVLSAIAVSRRRRGSR